MPDDFTMLREFTQEGMMYVHRLFRLFSSSLTVDSPLRLNLANKFFLSSALPKIGKIFTRTGNNHLSNPPGAGYGLKRRCK